MYVYKSSYINLNSFDSYHTCKCSIRCSDSGDCRHQALRFEWSFRMIVWDDGFEVLVRMRVSND